MLFQIILKAIHIVYADASYCHAYKPGVNIKNGFNDKTPFFKACIIYKSLAYVSSSYNYKAIEPVKTQYLFNLVIEVFNIIPITLLAKPAEIVKILTNLTCSYVHFFTKFFR
ncbi:hypothetical protein SDC9_128190 [bioreactor metagenome]|uniref:Uncharacterized protein n=1 Tax=bioreactor metagenome TaxID=1076179 RepID=A0A645CWB1_9ZZZZ